MKHAEARAVHEVLRLLFDHLCTSRSNIIAVVWKLGSLCYLHVIWKCRNGLIDRAEFGHLAETTGAGTECAIFHWLADTTIDELFDQYADGEQQALTFESFKRLVRFLS